MLSIWFKVVAFLLSVGVASIGADQCLTSIENRKYSNHIVKVFFNLKFIGINSLAR